MARGKKTSPELVYAIMLSYFTTNNYEQTAKDLNLPKPTVYHTVQRNKDKEEFKQLETKKKEEFADTATKIIDKGLRLLDRRITTALDNEEEIETLLEELSSQDMNKKTKTALYNKIKQLELQKLSEITTAVGTLYDKRALSRGEATQNTGVIMKFIDDIE